MAIGRGSAVRAGLFSAVGALALTTAACGAGGGDDGGSGSGGTQTINVATVSNPQMEDVQKLTKNFEKDNPNIKVKYTVLPENQLRDRVQQDVATQSGQFDVATVGAYEVQIWAKNGWIRPLDDTLAKNASYDVDDIVPAVKSSLSYQDKLYAVPFYSESSFLMYRKDLFEQAGLTMPDKPTWDQVADFAKKLDVPSKKQYGICLRGLAGWGENMAALDTVINTMGGTWYDMNWDAKVNTGGFAKAVDFYVNLVRDYGEPGAAKAGFSECLTNMTQGNAAMWYDATSAAGTVEDPNESKVAGKVGYVAAPTDQTENSGWLWSWSLAIPTSTKKADAASKFVEWATSKEYIKSVGEELGWSRVPPGTRESTYTDLPEYTKAAGSFADITINAIKSADVNNAGTEQRPYSGIQYVQIPEFQDLGTKVGQQVSAAIAGQKSVKAALDTSQELAEGVAEKGGYKK